MGVIEGKEKFAKREACHSKVFNTPWKGLVAA